MAVHRHFPYNLTKPERIFQKEWDKVTKSMCEDNCSQSGSKCSELSENSDDLTRFKISSITQ